MASSAADAPATPAPSSKDDEKVVNVDIVSDTMCPWCYVGKRHLELAIKDYPGAQFRINWLPFFLNEKLPADGIPAEQYFEQVYGSAEFMRQGAKRLQHAGSAVGIQFLGYENRKFKPTLLSHRLAEFAKRQNKGNEVMETIMKAYFVEGKSLNSVDDMVACAEAAGVSGAREFLQSDELTEEVRKEANKWKKHISGVPYFVITKPGAKKKLTFSGAQPVELFVEAFDSILKEK